MLRTLAGTVIVCDEPVKPYDTVFEEVGIGVYVGNGEGAVVVGWTTRKTVDIMMINKKFRLKCPNNCPDMFMIPAQHK